MKNLFKIFAIVFLFAFETNAATVTAASYGTNLNFGKIAPGTSTGTIASGCGATTGGVKIISGCQNGAISVTATNTSSATYGRSIKIYLTPSPTTLTGTPSGTLTSAFTIASPLPTNCVAEDTGIRCVNPTTTNGNSRTWNIPIRGALSNIASNQATGNYTGNFSVLACSCCTLVGTPSQCTDTLCPTTPSNYKCTNAALVKTFSGSFPARIVTSLSVVAGNNLQFGSVVAGTGGTINQAGATTGGVTAISSARSAGQFTVSGEATAGIPYSFTLPSSVTLSCDTGVTTSCAGAPNMTSTLSFSAGTASRTLNASGQDIVNINGVLTIGNGQSVGNYKGTYNVTVNY